MKLSTVFELLLIFLIIAFAASKVTDLKKPSKWTSLVEKSAEKDLRKDRQTPPSRFCSCSNLSCNCCRDFTLPIVPVSGPGCASLKYIQGDSMLLTMSFGDKVLRNVTISGKKPKPICMNLPGGVSKFCGRVYGISRESDQIRACLGLELRAQDDVEAALRVSCFRLGPNGLNVEPGKPVPTDEDNEDDDDDDDDDDFELPGDDDDDDDEADDDDDDDEDDDVFGLGEDDESENAVESGESDYGGLSALSDEFIESFFESDTSNKKKKPSTTSAAVSANKPPSVKPAPTVLATTPLPAKTIKPAKAVTTKVVSSSAPSKIVSSANSERIVQTTHKYVTTERMPIIDRIPTVSTIDKVYVSPTQYKPTEKIRPPIVQQPLESYIPTVPQLSTEKVYTSPQQISTDKIVYMSTINQYHPKEETQSSSSSYAPNSSHDIKEQVVANLFTPTTQQFPSTERIFMPLNSSTVAAITEPIGDFEPVTSTLMTVNVMQSNGAEEVANETKLVDKAATEVTPDSEYNEVDSDTKTTIDSRYESNTLRSSTTPLAVNRHSTLSLILSSTDVTSSPSSSTELIKSNNKNKDSEKDGDDDDDFTDVMETAASVFGSADEESTKPDRNETASDDSESLDDAADSEEDSDETGIVLGSNQDQQSPSSEIGIEENDGKDEEDSENDENEDKEDADEDGDDDDDFRKFRKYGKKSKTSVTASTISSLTLSTTAPIVHNGREHKRMNLPPLFSHRPEISSFWSSGGHLYKIRMSPVEQDVAPSVPAPSLNRLGRLNLFVPASETYPVTSSEIPSSSTKTTPVLTDNFPPSHRFKVGEPNIRNHTDRSRRNNKLLRMPETDGSGNT